MIILLAILISGCTEERDDLIGRDPAQVGMGEVAGATLDNLEDLTGAFPGLIQGRGLGSSSSAPMPSKYALPSGEWTMSLPKSTKCGAPHLDRTEKLARLGK